MSSIPVPWFLWSIIWPMPGLLCDPDGIRAHPIKGFESQEECEKARDAYRIEVDWCEKCWHTWEVKALLGLCPKCQSKYTVGTYDEETRGIAILQGKECKIT